MYSCKQVRDEFVPLFIGSDFFLLYLEYHEGKSGLETMAWFREAGPTLTTHVRRLQVNFGVSWSDKSCNNFAPSDSKPTTRVTDFTGLHIEVSHDGHLKLSQAYDTKFDERVFSDIKDKVGQSLNVGSTGLMGFDEFKIMYEVLQQYHPGFVYAKDPQDY